MSNLRLLDPTFGDNFETAVRRFFSPSLFEGSGEPQLKMRIDVSESNEAFTVKADVPGVKKEDISVDIDGNVVRISAECRSEKETKGDGEKVLRSERYYGTIARSFSLGQDVDESRAQAKYADGVLTLQLPKKATAATRKIEIQ